MSGFNVNTAASSGAAPGSLFGTSNTSGAGSGGLFTGANNSTTWGFGGQGQSSTSGGEQRSLFGTADNKSASSLFSQPAGVTSTSQPPTFSFGKTPTSGAPSPGFGTPKATPATQTLFGSTTPAPNTSQPFSLGTSTTPAGPPPLASGFGASTGGVSLFGGGNKPAENTAPRQTFSLMPPANPTANTPSAISQPPSVGVLFGGAKPASSFSFDTLGEKPTAPTNSATPAASRPAFNLPKPTVELGLPATTSAPGASLFGAVLASSTTPSLFGSAPPSAQPAQLSTSQSSASNLFGKSASTPTSAESSKPAFSFPSSSSQPQALATPATSSNSGKSLFGALGGSGSVTPAGGNLFGKPIETTAPPRNATPTTTAPASNPPFAGLGSTINAAQGGTAFGTDPELTPSTTGPVPPAQSRLKNKTMDEILTRWATDLTKYTKEFKNNAETVAKWDQTIVDNTSKIDKLYVRTRTCEKQTMSVEMQLSAVENQQAELESWLTKYENEVDEMLAKDNANPAELGGPDQERERTYKLADKLQERLDDMGRDLESMVEEVNAANASLSKNGKADEPITQIVRILNSHLSQLQAIDQGTAKLQEQVIAAQKAVNGLGYMNGTNDGRAVVDDFYRSYLGRR